MVVAFAMALLLPDMEVEAGHKKEMMPTGEDMLRCCVVMLYTFGYMYI